VIALDLDPTPRALRQFGAIALVVFGALATLAWLGVGWPARTGLVGVVAFAIIAALSGLFALVFPRGNRPLFVLLSVVAFPIGFVVSHVVLATIYFGLFTPIGLVRRALGKDPLHLRRDPNAKSYWTAARPPRDKNDYFRQF
jgi:hypothetical protein